MKQLFLILSLLLCIVSFSHADVVVETLTFGWDQNDLTNVDDWEMHWGVTPGGPYAIAGTILYDGNGNTGQQAPLEATVTGNPETTEIRYFVLKACGDVTQEGGSIERMCSEWSNEVSHDFWIPFGGFEVPVQFRIIVQ